jgi:hypothetical protein
MIQSENQINRPWVSIWTKPKTTIRGIIEADPQRHLILLAGISGLLSLLNSAFNRKLGDQLSFLTILALVVIAGPIAGVIGLYLGGAILRWSGGLLGGKASQLEVRAAIAWSRVPQIAAGILLVGGVVILGPEAFTTEAPRFDAFLTDLPRVAGLSVYYGLVALEIATIVLSFWGLVILWLSISEVHGFSAWRAFAATLTPAAIVIVPLTCLAIVSYLIVLPSAG